MPAADVASFYAHGIGPHFSYFWWLVMMGVPDEAMVDQLERALQIRALQIPC
jgi:hypothetical protein